VSLPASAHTARRSWLESDLVAWLPALRAATFVATFALAWITLSPFKNLESKSKLELSSGNEANTYLAFALLGLCALAALGPRLRYLRPCLANFPMAAMAAWLALSVVLSHDPPTSLKRLFFTVLVAIVVACQFLIPRDQREMARLFAVPIAFLLLACYAGVLFAPHLAVHQATDIFEAQLAGDWRGTFDHKNGAAAVMSFCLFLSLFIARSGMPIIGTMLAIGSSSFIILSGGKSSLMVVAVTLIVSFAWCRLDGKILRIAMALCPAILMNLAGVGSVLFPAVGQVTASLPLDVSFTGRTDVWQFAINRLKDHLIIGYGFQAFWSSPEIRFGAIDEGWGANAAHAHNSYLELVVGMGLPGLALGLAVFVVQPIRDILSAERRGVDAALLQLMFQIWCFGISLAAMESFLFNRGDAIWVTFLFALVGLRCAACHPLRRIER
jgi:O-antigen ligase